MSGLLRTGYSTGTCAGAAAKAAALCLRGEIIHAVEIELPDGSTLTIPVEHVERIANHSARACVIKDAGDDPDVTNGMTVQVLLEIKGEEIIFDAGEGVGTVTSPGLQIPAGEPAINPVPRQMIATAIRDILGDAGCRVTVSIPGGEAVALKTFNPRLGISGGLSILGTSGRVMPKSEDAWLRSLVPQIDVAIAAGERTLYLTPGGFGETAAREPLQAPSVAIVNTSNFIGDMLRAAAERGAERVVLVGHIGKLVKIAAGIFNTHSRFGDARLETVAAIAAAEGAPGSLVSLLLALPTCEAAIPVLEAAGLAHVWHAIAARAATRATQHAGIPVNVVLIGYERTIIGQSDNSREKNRDGITIVGIGPGTPEWLTPAAWREIRRAEVLVGGKRHLAEYAVEWQQQIAIGADISAVIAAIRASAGQQIVVMASGDPGCYGILNTLKREMPEMPMCVIPGISAMQMALARLGEPWEGVIFSSAHGRPVSEVIADITTHPRVLALTDHKVPAQALAIELLHAGISAQMTVLERLGYPDERITQGTVNEIAGGQFDPLAVVWITREVNNGD